MGAPDEPAGPDHQRALAAAIAARDPDAFFEALESIEAVSRDVPLARLPEPLRIIRVLFYLQMDMDPELGGVEAFLLHYPEEVGAYAPDAEGWCRSIGAPRTAEYLARAIALFPGGVVPTDYSDRATMAGEAAEAGPDAFEDLDREYADARPELAARLRAYLQLHKRDLEASIAEARRIAEQVRSLPAVLEVEDPVAFLENVFRMVESADPSAYGRLSEVSPATLVARVLVGLNLTVGADGIWKFLAEQETGAYLPHAERWCRVLGAHRAAEYLREVASLFPGGRIPTDDDDRYAALEQIEDAWAARRSAHPDDPGSRYDPLRTLDKRYEGAMDEMVEALRTHLRAHATDARQARDVLARIAEAGP